MIRLCQGRWAALLTALFVAAAQAQAGERAAACAICHGVDGNSVRPGTPSIAGQPRVFLENYLVMSREGLRGSDDMKVLLNGVPDRDIAALARYFTALPARPDGGTVDETLFRRGRNLADKYNCASCHESNYRGREQMPRLAGQREEFLAEMMLQYRHNRRPGGDTMMSAVLYGISEDDFKALAHYFSRLK